MRSLSIKFSNYIDFQMGHYPVIAGEIAKLVVEMKERGNPVYVVDDEGGMPIFRL
jgi:hypothetical protein